MKVSLRFSLCAALSVSLPVLLFAANSYRNGHTVALAELDLIAVNWLFMAAPHLLVIGLALIYRPFLHGQAPLVLLALCVLLAAFQGWVWWSVPPRESGLAWVLYIPVWLSVLVVFYGYHQFVRIARNKRRGL